MKARKADDLSVLRMLVSAIRYAEIDAGGELDDAGVINALMSEAKKRREAVEAYRGNNEALADREAAELVLIETYLPEALSDTEIETVIDEVLAAVGEEPDVGPVMGQVMGRLKGRMVDGKRVRELVEKAVGSR
jgi:hypothetical protein